MIENSLSEIKKAGQVVPGSTINQVDIFKKIKKHPLVFKSGAGSKITDSDNNEYIDYSLSRGVHILGHSPDPIIKEIEKNIRQGISFGAPTINESILTELLTSIYPSIEKVQFVNSAEEAVLNVITQARGYTRKNIIIKFDGCYHGNIDCLLTSSEKGNTDITSTSLKVTPTGYNGQTLSLPFNNTDAINQTFEKYSDDIAAIIVEPVPANMGIVLPETGFLEFLRNISSQYGSVLIFDEVTTGFRAKIGGAQEYYKIIPDITILGKILGGGFPIAAYGGKKEMMDFIISHIDSYPAKFSYANHLAMVAGIQTVKQLSYPLFYRQLNQKTGDFIHYLREITQRKGIILNNFLSMFTLFFNENEVKNFADAQNGNAAHFNKFNSKLLEKGIYFAPSQFDANFVSAAHTPEDLNKTLEIVNSVLKSI